MSSKRAGSMVVAALTLVVGLSVSATTVWCEEKPPELINLEKLPRETAEATRLKKAVEREVDGFSGRILEMNDWMYYNPETGHKEFQASKTLSEELEKHGFVVKFGVEGLEESYNKVVSGLLLSTCERDPAGVAVGAVGASPTSGLRSASKELWKTEPGFPRGCGLDALAVHFEAGPQPRQLRQLPQPLV